MLIKGTTITLWKKTVTEIDGFNEPIYAWTSEQIDNVLIGEPTPQERIDELTLTGRSIDFTLGIPKGDMHDWEDQIVEFFGHKYLTYGIPAQGIEENVPGPWHKKVKCQRYE